MTRYESYPDYQDVFEYHGNTTIVRIRQEGGQTVKRDWILSASVEETQEFFNNNCTN
jgi:hypothetical protein